MRRVLLVEPYFHVHTLVHFEAALTSDGFQDAHFILLVGGIAERDRERISQFERENPRVTLRRLPLEAPVFLTRWDSWKGYALAVRMVERILKREKFDFFAYLMLDNALPCFVIPGARFLLPAHFAAGVRGLLLRDNGLRPPLHPTLKEKVRSWLDRLILKRTLRSGALRKVAFFDHRCADTARAEFGEQCGYGVDPIDPHPRDPVTARAKLGIAPDSWMALMFGVISSRKGVVETVRALASGNFGDSSLLIVLAGPVEPDLRPALESAVESAGRHFRIIWRDEFIPEPEMPDYFAAANCVICAYKNFNASSGVLLLAASQRKPAIVSREGVMHDAVERFGFGLAVDLDNPSSLTGAVRQLMNLSPAQLDAMSAGARKYAESMDARRYMAQFL